jgi:hypothetical protein
VREFADSSDESATHLHIYGDTGVGKSRLVLEALNVEPLSNKVFACPRADRVKTEALEGIVNSEAVAVLVVDDVTQTDAQSLIPYAAGARGRLRVVTIGERPRRDAVAGRATLDVQPLAPGLIASLVSSVTGLSDEQGELVASLADGYPKLAAELAHELASAEDVGSVVQLLQTANISGLLERMIPHEATRNYIAHLALVDRLGFDDDLAFEANQLCEVFNLDRIAFVTAIGGEQGRFVSEAGRYRLATPRALAMWLVRDLIQRDPAAFADRVVLLPEQLFDAFRRQIELLGDDRLVAELLQEVLTRKGESFLRATEISEEFARLLRAIAFAVPELAASRIRELVFGENTQSLLQFNGPVRREFVWALSHLLWFETTFQASADSLFRLALAESERYGNNSTGTIVGAFGVHLGGTQVPLSDRLGWLSSTYQEYGSPGASLAASCAAHALETMETRMGGWTGSRLQPVEWRPADLEEEQRVRSEALRLLLNLAAHDSEIAAQVAQEVGTSFRGLASRGMAEVTLSAISEVEWTGTARAKLASGLRGSLYYDAKTPTAIRRHIEESLNALQGESLEDQIDIALSTRYWDLTVGTEERLEGPAQLEELAEAVARDARDDLVSKYAQQDSGYDDMTVHMFYQQLGSRGLPAGEQLASDGSTSLAARTGYVIGRVRRGDTDWAESVIASWTHDSTLALGVAPVVHQIGANPKTLDLAIEPVEAGFAPLSTLNQFMLGAWIKPLSSDELNTLLLLYARQELEYHDLDAALHMLLFWLDDDANEPTEQLLETAKTLILKTQSFPDSSGGIPYVRSRLLKELPFSQDQRLQLILVALQQKTFPSDEELSILDDIARSDPEHVVHAVTELLLSDEFGWSLYLDRASLLSRLERATGSGVVIAEVINAGEEAQEQLLRHVDFLGDEPDPLLLALLESRSDESFSQEAATRFLYPGEVVTGSYAFYLEQRLGTLRQWDENSTSAKLHAWVSKLVPSLESAIEGERLREAERRDRD